MSLAPGTRLGTFEIVSAIGAGGMGEVYRARDTRLNREVAIKVLPSSMTNDPERLARLEREAQLLASLNHPNIAAIYHVDEAQGAPAIVMELVEGETLADRIARGAIPIDEALSIAKQIADALEAAHDQRIIHRDLKPANIKLTQSGTVKVLDFGLAKLTEPGGAGQAGVGALSLSPTITSPVLMTGVGALLGTAAYMAPEQARGKAVDKRADIWAFGVIVYEMVTGERPFAGDAVTDLLASVVKDDVDLARVPSAAHDLVRLCLQKDPSKRLRDIGDVALLSTPSPAAFTPAASPRSTTWRRAIPVALTALLAAAAASTATWVALRPVPAPVTHLSFAIDSELHANGRGSLAISHDGRRIAYVLNTNQLFVRDLGAFDARPLAGEVNGDVFFVSPAFSPDGESIAFWSSDFGIKRIPVMGGAATRVVRLDEVPNGIEWRGDDILFIPSGRRIMRVSSRGGPSQTLATFGPGEEAYGPRVLPDGDHVLLTMRSSSADWSSAKIVVQSLRSAERKTIVETGQDPHYVRTGHLIYAVGGVLFAAAFDAARLESRGAGVPIIEGVLGTGGSSGVGAASQFAVSDAGTLVYMPGNAAVSGGQDIAIIARDGTLRPLNLPVRTYGHVRVSPDGRRIAFTLDEDNESNIWVFDLDGHTAPRRLTFGGNNRYPIWSPDGTRVTFASDRDARPGLYSQMADGSAPGERLTSADGGTIQVPESWSPDGDRLLYTVTKADNVTLWTFSMQNRSSGRFTDVESTTLTGAVFSPDGRWVAYATSNTLFVQPFPPTGVRYQISKTNGGHHPIWSRNGHELWYEPGPSQLVAVPVTLTPSFAFGAPVPLPSAQFGSTAPANPRNRDIMPDGRWVSPIPAYRASPDMAAVPSALQVQVVLNWFQELRKKVPLR